MPNQAPRGEILLVDDEPAVRLSVSRYLRSVGFSVCAAREREEAEALIATRTFSAVLTDLRLSAAHRAEGLEILGFAREHCPDVPVVLMTGYGSRDVQLEAQLRGASAVLAKPTPLPEVAQLLMALIQEER